MNGEQVLATRVSDLADAPLVQRFCDGDMSAFSELHSKYENSDAGGTSGPAG